MKPRCATHPLTWNRHEDFVWVFAFQGLDLTGATFSGAVRAIPDGGGASLVTLGTVSSDTSQGFHLQQVTTETIDFGGDVGVRTVSVSYVNMRILKAVADGFTYPVEKGDDLPLFWDMHITPATGDEYRALEGDFTVRAGAVGSS